MGNNFTPPSVEKRDNAVDAQVAEEKKNTEQKQTRQVSSTVDLYKGAIDEYVKFLKGEVAAGDLEERRNTQKSFITTVWNMLNLDYPDMKECLDYFLITVKGEPNACAWSNIVAPLSALEGKASDTELTRYKRFMLFITLLSEHARDRTQFAQMFDMTKFEAMFSEKARTNLHTYVYR